MAITVLIADDSPAVRSEMKRILRTDPEMAIVGEASSGREAISLAESLGPQIVLLDVEMERPDAGIIAAQRIHETNPGIRIIVLTIHTDETTVLAAFQAGIVDFLIKEQASESLNEAIHLAMRNKSPMRPIVTQYLRAELDNMQHREEQLLFTIRVVSSLTASELAILRDIVVGKARKQIARERFVEIVTIKKHVNGIHKKFGTTSTQSIVKQVRSLGIFDVIDSIFPDG